MTKSFPKPCLSRRGPLAGAGALGLDICLPRPGTAGTTIVSTIFGGKFEEVYPETIVEPFGKKTGHDVTLKLGSGSQWLTTAMVSKASPEIDVVWLACPESVKAINEDLSIELLPAELPNLVDVEPIWFDTYKRKAVGIDYSSFGLAYRTDKINPTPTGWADLWKPEYKSKLAVPDLTMSGDYETLVMAAKLNDGSEANIEPGFAAMKKLRTTSANSTSPTPRRCRCSSAARLRSASGSTAAPGRWSTAACRSASPSRRRARRSAWCRTTS